MFRRQELGDALEGLVVGKQRAEQRRQAAFSDRTKKQYNSLWRSFLQWWVNYAPEREPVDVTAEELTWYLAEREECGRAYSTLLADYNAIDFAVRRAGRKTLRNSRDVAEYLAGFRREERPMQVRKHAILPPMLADMVSDLPDTPIGLRNRALLSVGWASAQRREELLRMTLASLTSTLDHDNYFIWIPFSKTDQEGKGRETAIHANPNWPWDASWPNPLAALDTWLDVCRPDTPEKPIFCGLNHNNPTKWALVGNDVARIVQARAKAIGVNPKLYGGHSLRAGFVTYLFSVGKTWKEIAAYTGHTSEVMAKKYDRPGSKPYVGLK